MRNRVRTSGRSRRSRWRKRKEEPGGRIEKVRERSGTASRPAESQKQHRPPHPGCDRPMPVVRQLRSGTVRAAHGRPCATPGFLRGRPPRLGLRPTQLPPPPTDAGRPTAPKRIRPAPHTSPTQDQRPSWADGPARARSDSGMCGQKLSCASSRMRPRRWCVRRRSMCRQTSYRTRRRRRALPPRPNPLQTSSRTRRRGLLAAAWCRRGPPATAGGTDAFALVRLPAVRSRPAPLGHRCASAPARSFRPLLPPAPPPMPNATRRGRARSSGIRRPRPGFPSGGLRGRPRRVGLCIGPSGAGRPSAPAGVDNRLRGRNLGPAVWAWRR